MSPSMDTPARRRSILKLLGATAGAAAVGSVVTVNASEHGEEPIVLEQGDECLELLPLSGDLPVEEFYDYRFRTDNYDGLSDTFGYSFSSHGTTDYQADATSVLFLYDGPAGLSLVVVHGRYEGDDDGGVVSFSFDGMPADAEWVVRDDYYLLDGEPAPTNHDQWDVDGTTQQVDWAYEGGRTDGGAALGLGDDFEVTITPAFNDDAVLADNHPEKGPIESWEAVTADGDPTERLSLDMAEPVTIRTGGCEPPVGDEPTETPTEEPTDTPVDEPTDEPTETPDDEPTDTPADEPTDTPEEGDGTGDEDHEVC